VEAIKLRVACIGECMVEMAPVGNGQYRQNFAGDTYNTSVYLQRLFGHQLQVSYVTALGEDALSQAMLEHFRTEHIDTTSIRIIKDQQPGLYIIENDAQGERFFQYWRANSAASNTFKDMTCADIVALLKSYDLIFLSGISLAILDPNQRQTLLQALTLLASDTQIAFDPNFRPALWPKVDECRLVFEQMAGIAHLVLSSFEDDQAVWETADVITAQARWRGWGCPEVIIKHGGQGCWLFGDQLDEHVAPQHVLAPVDTTGAGDSFCAGYIGARLIGQTPVQSAQLGHQIAAQVVMHAGAVINL